VVKWISGGEEAEEEEEEEACGERAGAGACVDEIVGGVRGGEVARGIWTKMRPGSPRHGPSRGQDANNCSVRERL
jgi:hypothetical protein